MATTTMEDLAFEEAFRVVKVDDTHYEGAHPLLLPMLGARGVYGGHICAQTTLVAMESAPDYVLHLLHSHFISPPSAKRVCRYEVEALQDGAQFARRLIKMSQLQPATGVHKVMYTCTVSLVRRGVRLDSPQVRVQRPPTAVHQRYPDPDALNVVKHTTFVKNAYSEELVDYNTCPQEETQPLSERWITVFSGINQPQLFKDPKLNYVGLSCISDSCLLTTLARVLRLPWNPTEMAADEEFDESKDALLLFGTSMNMIHLFHYQAMSLDHHIYFHCDDENAFDVVKDWLTFSYQFKTLSNGRLLVRGGMYTPNGRCVATVVQEGLAILHPQVASRL